MKRRTVNSRRFWIWLWLIPLLYPVAGLSQSLKLDSLTPEQLEEIINNTYATESERVKALFELGLRYETSGQYEKALKTYDSLLEKLRRANALPSQQINVHYRKGVTLYKLKRYPEAIKACQEAFNLVPNADLDPDMAAILYYTIGMSETRLGDSYKAQAAFEAFMKLEPRLTEAVTKEQIAEVAFNLGRFRRQDDNLQGATDAFEYVRVLEPFLQSQGGKELVRHAYINLAEIAGQTGDAKKERDYYAQAAEHLAVDEAGRRLLVEWAQKAVDEGDDKWAGELVEKIPVQRTSSDLIIGVSLLQADIRIRQGNLAEALYDLKRAIVLIEENEFWKRKGSPEEAEEKRAYIDQANTLLKLAKQLSQQVPQNAKKGYEAASKAYKAALHKIPGIYYKHPVWAGDANLGEAEIAYYYKEYANAAYDYNIARQSYQHALSTDRSKTHGTEDNDGQLEKKLVLATYGWADSQHRAATVPHQYQYAVRAYEEAERKLQLLSSDDDQLRADLEKEIWIGKTECYQRLNLREDAKETALQLKEVALRSPSDVPLLVQVADLLFKQAAYDEAAQAYQQALDLSAQERIRILTQLALCFFHKAEQSPLQADDSSLRQAIQIYNLLLREVPQEDPLLNDVRYNKGLAHYKLGEHEQARELFEQVVASDRTGEMTRLVVFPLAESYERTRQFDDAIRVYEHAIRVYRGAKAAHQEAMTLARWRLGELYRAKNNYPQAIIHYEQLVQQDPESDLAKRSLYFLGQCYEKQNRFSQAEKVYQDVLTNDPKDENWADAAWKLVQFAKRDGAFPRVIELCQRLIERYPPPQNPHITQLLDVAQREIISAIESLPSLTKAQCELLRQELRALAESDRTPHPEKIAIYRKIARSHEDAGEYQQALFALSQAKQIASDEFKGGGLGSRRAEHAQICYTQALIYNKLGEWENVFRSSREALSDSPEPELAVHLHYLRGYSALKLNDLDEAPEAFEAAAELATSLGRVELAAQSSLTLGTILAQRGQNDEATRAFAHARQHAQVWEAEKPEEAKAVHNEATLRLARIREQSPDGFEEARQLWEELAGGTSDARVKAEALYKQAVLQSQQGDFEGARLNLERLLKDFTSEGEADIRKMIGGARLRLPDIYRELQDLDAAIHAAKDVVAQAEKQSAPAELFQAQFDLARLYHEKANQHIDKSETYRQFAREAGQMYSAAYTTAKKGGVNDELKRIAAYQAGTLLYRMEDFKKATPLLEAFVQIAPNAPETPAVLDQLGWCYINVARVSRQERERNASLQKAVDAFSRLVNEFPDYGRADAVLYDAGVTLMTLGEHQRAIDAFEQLQKHYPQSPRLADALKAQGDLWFEKKQFAQAKAAFQNYLEKFPDSEGADAVYYKIAKCCHHLKDPDATLDIYATIQRRFPKSYWAARVQVDIAHSYYEKADHSRAFQEYRRLTSANFPGTDGKLQEEAHTWMIKASDQLAWPLYTEASDEYQKARYSQSEKERQAAASKVLKLSREVVTEYPYSRYADAATVLMGGAYELLGKPQEALKTYEEFVRRKERQKSLDSETKNFLDFAKERMQQIREGNQANKQSSK